MGVTFWLAITCIVAVASQAKCDLQSDILEAESQISDIHSRSRRYVVFPEGSTFNAAFCITIKSTTGPDEIFTEGVNWAISYDLPNETIHDKKDGYEFPVLIRRHKRDLYIRMEKLIDSAGIDGRECVLRTICEVGQQLAPRQGILEEIFRILFMNPVTKERGSKLHKIYQQAYETGTRNENCNDMYPCPFSILDLGLSFGEFPHPSEYIN
ncbi:UNVERIFIED_CONTAM: hypothetical protein PYX00_008020 [Menopon gallinae]|uniref:Uncharacterized protein n=1 Tax=Menopon gallinae TaxID=328185 RepID=A0AAW2HMA8_9NEOP